VHVACSIGRRTGITGVSTVSCTNGVRLFDLWNSRAEFCRVCVDAPKDQLPDRVFCGKKKIEGLLRCAISRGTLDGVRVNTVVVVIVIVIVVGVSYTASWAHFGRFYEQGVIEPCTTLVTSRTVAALGIRISFLSTRTYIWWSHWCRCCRQGYGGLRLWLD
jgi:hypothetical protein